LSGTPRLRFLTLSVAVVGLATGLVTATPAGATTATSARASGPGHAPAVSTPAAAAALRRAEHLVTGRSVVERSKGATTYRSDAVRPRRVDATLTLVALRHAIPALSRVDRRTARAILARPTDGNPKELGAWTATELSAAHGHSVCGPDVCVNWTDVGPNRPDVTADADHNSIPDQVDATLATMEDVWSTEVDTFGYTAPKKDFFGEQWTTGAGDPAKLDIYLSNVGVKGLYGFCAPEQNARKSFGYCVLDNDYSAAEFGTSDTPLQNLQVTAAHEFFHAVQFNYDSYEDAWFMESTAAWMEDEVYPDVNDNLQYLNDSPFSRPTQSLDKRDASYLSTYGSWIFMRYLSERLGRTIIRSAWEHAVGATTYSTQALSAALSARHRTLSNEFADFAAANREPTAFYAPDGPKYVKYAAAPATVVQLNRARPSTGWLQPPALKHLSSITLRLKPGTTTGHLQLQLVAPTAVTSPRVRLVIVKSNGTVTIAPVTFSAGRATVSGLLFNTKTIKRVEVVAVNASWRTQCGQGTTWPCGGRPLDDHSVFRVRATRTA
jgi:hypothetical protein